VDRRVQVELLGAWCSRVSLSGGVVFVYLQHLWAETINNMSAHDVCILGYPQDLRRLQLPTHSCERGSCSINHV